MHLKSQCRQAFQLIWISQLNSQFSTPKCILTTPTIVFPHSACPTVAQEVLRAHALRYHPRLAFIKKNKKRQQNDQSICRRISYKFSSTARSSFSHPSEFHHPARSRSGKAELSGELKGVKVSVVHLKDILFFVWSEGASFVSWIKQMRSQREVQDQLCDS